MPFDELKDDKDNPKTGCPDRLLPLSANRQSGFFTLMCLEMRYSLEPEVKAQMGHRYKTSLVSVSPTRAPAPPLVGGLAVITSPSKEPSRMSSSSSTEGRVEFVYHLHVVMDARVCMNRDSRTRANSQ